MSNLYQLKDYTQERLSSYDRTGANDDGNWKNPIKAGETRTIGDIDGPGIITHFWFTINSHEAYHLKKIVLRVFWDNDPLPAIESPIGDFFGLGLGQYFMYESRPLSVGSQKALNCWFPIRSGKTLALPLPTKAMNPLKPFITT